MSTHDSLFLPLKLESNAVSSSDFSLNICDLCTALRTLQMFLSELGSRNITPAFETSFPEAKASN